MVVCHCHAVNDATIRRIVGNAEPTAEAIADLCGAGTDCGGCLETIERLLASSGRDTTVAIG